MRFKSLVPALILAHLASCVISKMHIKVFIEHPDGDCYEEGQSPDDASDQPYRFNISSDNKELFYHKLLQDAVVHQSQPKESNSRGNPHLNIVGGAAVTINNYPYMAMYGNTCGATIIGRNWLITAAHCGKKHQYVKVGSAYIKHGRVYIVEKHIVHPVYTLKNSVGWNKESILAGLSFDYDFQLLKTEKKIVFSNYVKPIRLGDESDIVPGTLAAVSGWGQQSEGVGHRGSLSFVLKSVSVPIITSEECKASSGGLLKNLITDRMICAGYYDGQKDACNGDSGGPLVRNDRLIGVVSFGIGCAQKNFPGVYSKIPAAKEWILSKIRQDLKRRQSNSSVDFDCNSGEDC